MLSSDNTQPTPGLDAKTQLRVALKLMHLWSLDNRQVNRTLGSHSDDVNELATLRTGDTSKGLSPERLSHLLTIHTMLKSLYPQPKVCYSWMKKPNGAFEGLSPVEVIDRFEMRGLLMVRAYLERALHHRSPQAPSANIV